MERPSSIDLLAALPPWFNRVRRNLPWRAEDLDGPHGDPYAVLVSELMLQQTQVVTVVPYFRRWMEQFPTAQALAEAEDDTIHKAWEGLGYYRRARFLKAAAGTIAAEGWPGDLGALTGLPGLGPYTAAAVGAIAFQWPTAALDGNAFRVLARLLLIEGDPKAQAAGLRTWLAPALQTHGPSRLTQALMELGATVCMPTPACATCPLSPKCQARKAARTTSIPPIVKRAKVKACAIWLVALEAQGHFLLQCPSSKGLLAGLWRWPTFDTATMPSQPRAQNPFPVTAWPAWKQVYTHRREEVTPLHIRWAEAFSPGEGLRWIPQAELTQLPLGKRDQRLRNLLATPGHSPLAAPDGAAIRTACAAPWP